MPGPKLQSAFDVALEALGRREKTRAALSALLTARGFAEDEVQAALERLEALGYLNEGRALSSRARAMLAVGRSRAHVVARLVEEGADEARAAQAVEDVSSERGQSDEQVARALLVRRRLVGAKAARFLASRGFDEALIRALVPGLDAD